MTAVVQVIHPKAEVVTVAQAVGPKGEPGRDGIDGLAGAPGRDGVDGRDGLPGADGQPGTDGRDGADGTPGRDGKDGINGLPGERGTDGRDGADGPPGLPGAPGKDGTDGLPGTPGADGAPGRDGQDGAPGDTGPAGPGVPTGGNPGQVLAKATGIDFDTLWVDPPAGGGGPAFSRETTVLTTGNLASGATEIGTITLAASYRLLRLTTDRPSRIRLYTNTAKRAADLERPIGIKPTGDHGRLFESVTTGELPAFDCSPTVDGFTEDGTSAVPYSIASTSPTGGAIKLTLTWIRTE